jgi:hypothetical protein
MKKPSNRLTKRAGNASARVSGVQWSPRWVANRIYRTNNLAKCLATGHEPIWSSFPRQRSDPLRLSSPTTCPRTCRRRAIAQRHRRPLTVPTLPPLTHGAAAIALSNPPHSFASVSTAPAILETGNLRHQLWIIHWLCDPELTFASSWCAAAHHLEF